MNIVTIQKEISSPALKAIVEDLDLIVENIRAKKISYQQGNAEITGRKHIIQSIALDWAFGTQRKLLEGGKK